MSGQPNSDRFERPAIHNELRSQLRLSVAEAVALREYREKNGPFKSVEDLKKVSGLDAAKIEGFKAKLLF